MQVIRCTKTTEFKRKKARQVSVEIKTKKRKPKRKQKVPCLEEGREEILLTEIFKFR